MKMKILITILPLVFISCMTDQSIIQSSGKTLKAKMEILGNAITIKSDVNDVYFKLYDVNRNSRSILGPTNKDYKICIFVNPSNVDKWVDDKKVWITSFPKNINWINDLSDMSESKMMMKYGFITYYKEENGMKYTIWTNNEKGIILIHYIQE